MDKIIKLCLVSVFVLIICYCATAQTYQSGSQNSNTAAAWESKGVALFQQGSYSDAYYAFSQAIKLDPQNEDHWSWLAATLDELGRADDAFQAYSQCVKLNPNDDFAWYWIAGYYLDHNKFDEATKAIDNAITIKPQDGSYWTMKGDIFAQIALNSGVDPTAIPQVNECYAKARELGDTTAGDWENSAI